MPIELDALIKTTEATETQLEKDIEDGKAAQARLAQVKAILTDLESNQKRRADLGATATTQLGKATAQAATITTGLAPLDTKLTALPAPITVAELDALADADLVDPPVAGVTKYDDYATAMATKDAALTKALTEVQEARATEAAARQQLDRAEASLRAACDAATAAAAKAQAAFDGAQAAGDTARLYWSVRQTKPLLAAVTDPATTKAVDDAKAALKTAFDAYADAVSERLAKEAALPKAQAERGKAADDLGAATALVLKRLAKEIAKVPVP